MKKFAHAPIAQFLNCECITSDYNSPIHPRSTTYAFKALSQNGTLSLIVHPEQGICSISQLDTHDNEIATATVYITELKVSEDIDQETGEDEEFISGAGPGGHICIKRERNGFSIFYSMYGDRLQHWPDTIAHPPNGLVPTKQVAIHIAEAILVPLYGATQINSQKPFKASLASGVWTIEGSYPNLRIPTGIALVKLRQEDGQILQVKHGEWP